MINNAERVLSALLENDLNLCCAAHVITQMQQKLEPCAFCASDYRRRCAGGAGAVFSLSHSLAFYFLGRTHSILVRSTMKCRLYHAGERDLLFFVAERELKYWSCTKRKT
jgi:hypothetical protein